VENSNKRQILETAISLVLVAVTAAYLWKTLGPRPAPDEALAPPQEPVSLADARYSTTTKKEIEKEYVDTGKVRLGFRHNPLTAIHPLAVRAAEAAECAGQQGKFWEMHDRLFEQQRELTDDLLLGMPAHLGLDDTRYRACMEGERRQKVEADTPVFMIGRVEPDGTMKVLRVISGSVPSLRFKVALDEAIDETEQLARN
jgi:hypothetical protein